MGSLKARSNKVDQQRLRNVERALRTERTALVALTAAYLRASGDPSQLLARVEAMARGVVDDKRSSPKLRDCVVGARQLIQRAVEVELGRPQTLFEPDVGHVDPVAVRDLAATGEQADQLGMYDPADDARQRSERERAVRETVVDCLRHAPLTDERLWASYELHPTAPLGRDRAEVRRARVELTRSGRVQRANQDLDGVPAWTLPETNHKEATK